MGRLAVVVGWLLAGCYDPHATAGAPCAEDGSCPAGQRCSVGACYVTSQIDDANFDAPTDGAPDDVTPIVDAPPDAFVPPPDAFIAPPMFVGVTGTDGTSGTAMVATTPPGVVIGDLLLAFASTDEATTTITAPQGWVKVTELLNATNGLGSVIYRRKVFDPNATYSWTFTPVTTARPTTVYTLAYRGVDSMTPVGDFQQQLVDNMDLVAPSVTPTRVNSLLVTLFSVDNSLNGTFGDIPNMTERFEHTVPAGFSVSGNDEVRAMPGATGTRTSIPTDQGAASCFALVLQPPAP